MKPETQERTTAQEIRLRAAELAAIRQRPCLIAVVPSIQRPIIIALRRSLAELNGNELDVILYSLGGDIDVAYLAARELLGRVQTLAIFVPLLAKSAATLVCLVADDLVFGPLGEIGPLDRQGERRPSAQVGADASQVLPFKAFQQLREAVACTHQHLFGEMAKAGRTTPSEASRGASELTGALYRPIFSQIDPLAVAESARGLEIAGQYLCRLLRRHRPGLHEPCEALAHHLVHGYPSHGFIIDREEAQEIGLPARGPEPAEEAILDSLGANLAEYDDASDIIELVQPGIDER